MHYQLNPRRTEIKRAQREAHLFREISSHFIRIVGDEPDLQDVWISRISLSSDGGICSVYLYTKEGQEAYHKKAGKLILYKPSLRAAIAQKTSGRYAPNIVFRYDETMEKQISLFNTFERLKEKGDL